MSKTLADRIAEAIDTGGGQACDVPGVLKALATAGFVIVPRATLEIYANPAHWEMRRETIGHGDSGDVLTWRGPQADRGYMGPTKGREYAAEALAAAKG